MPTIQPVQLGQVQGTPEALNMRKEYEDFIAVNQKMLQLFQTQHAEACQNFNRFQTKCKEALAMADATIASRASDPESDPEAHKELLARRDNFVRYFNLIQAKFVEGIDGLAKNIAALAEGQHHLIGLYQGRNVPAEAATVQQQSQAQQAPAPNTVEASQPPMVQSQVAEVIEKDGTRTVFENGAPVAVIPPQPGAVGNNVVVPEGGGQVVHGNGAIIPQ